MAFLVAGGLRLPGVVHGHEDGACLEQDRGEVMAQELGSLLLVGNVYSGKTEKWVHIHDVCPVFAN